jgi:hypothetical protein
VALLFEPMLLALAEDHRCARKNVALVPELAAATAPPGVRVFAPTDGQRTAQHFAAVRRGSITRPSVAATLTALKDAAKPDRRPDQTPVAAPLVR